MNKQMYSPGPWSFSGDTQESFPIRDANGMAVNLSHPANAALVATAPELLEALEWLHPKKGTWRTPDDEMTAKIEAVIAKATA